MPICQLLILPSKGKTQELMVENMKKRTVHFRFGKRKLQLSSVPKQRDVGALGIHHHHVFMCHYVLMTFMATEKAMILFGTSQPPYNDLFYVCMTHLEYDVCRCVLYHSFILHFYAVPVWLQFSLNYL